MEEQKLNSLDRSHRLCLSFMTVVENQNLAYRVNRIFCCDESAKSVQEGSSPGDDFPHEGHWKCPETVLTVVTGTEWHGYT